MKRIEGSANLNRQQKSNARTLSCWRFAKNITAALLGAAVFGVATVQAGTGAIFTSTFDGTIVNQNLYEAAQDVYLNGGPQNDNAAGLDPGTYYFQVTDPSGHVLLSTDNAEFRQVFVNASGRIAGVPPAGGPFHGLGTFNPLNGSTPVQLAPFAQTPNNGGEYKAWLIGPVETSHRSITIANDENGRPRVLVFSESDSKTDNFKIRETVEPPVGDPSIILSGMKYYDLNADGYNNNNEAGVQGFQIEVTIALSDGTTIIKTAITTATGGWSVSTPSSLELQAAPYEKPTGVRVIGFVACEVQPSPNPDGSYWMQTGPLLGDQTPNPHVVLLDNHNDYCWTGDIRGRTTPVTGLDFGNICVHQPSGGFTLGYWSNKNGQAVLQANDPAWRTLLNDCNLKRASGLNYDVLLAPTSFANAYKDFRTWILGATATNMAYMFSAQLTATKLDTTYKGLDPATLVFLPSETAMQADLAAGYGANVVGIGTVITEANADLGTVGHENTTSGTPGSAFRDHQECLKNILDNINNKKLLFVSPIPCAVTYPL